MLNNISILTNIKSLFITLNEDLYDINLYIDGLINLYIDGLINLFIDGLINLFIYILTN